MPIIRAFPFALVLADLFESRAAMFIIVIIELHVIWLIVILVTLTETTADILAVGEIIGTKVDSKRIAAGLRADMVSSAISPIFGSFTQSAFAQNVGLVAITGVKSRFVAFTPGWSGTGNSTSRASGETMRVLVTR